MKDSEKFGNSPEALITEENLPELSEAEKIKQEEELKKAEAAIAEKIETQKVKDEIRIGEVRKELFGEEILKPRDLKSDPRYKEIVEEASLNYLKSSDTKFLKENFSGELTADGRLKDKNGNDSLLKPSQNIGGGMGIVEKMARDEFAERHPESNAEYKQMEQTRVYTDPGQDPAYKEIEAHILKKINNDSQILSNNSSRTPEPGMDLWNRISVRENLHGWSNFVSSYPEKAAAYASQNEFIARELKRREQQREKEIQDDQSRETAIQEKPAVKVPSPVETVAEKPVTSSKKDESRPSEFRTENNEKIYKRFWDDDPELKNLYRHIDEETSKRLYSGNEMHENFAQHYSKVRTSVSAELWKDFIDTYPGKAQAYEKFYKEIRDYRERQETKPQEPRKVEFREPEVVKLKPEVVEVKKEEKQKEKIPHKEDIISEYLAYQDIPVSPDDKKAMLDYSMNNESGRKYAEALQELFSENPRAQIESISSHIMSETEEILKRFGVPGSAFLKSKTWAMWDIGKQYYFATHPEEADSNYEIANPLKSPKKIIEIIDRHVGWEAYRLKDRKFAEKYKKHPLYMEFMKLLGKPPKNNKGDLSSKDLAQLGSLMRNMSQ